jgi:hypothetical protein
MNGKNLKNRFKFDKEIFFYTLYLFVNEWITMFDFYCLCIKEKYLSIWTNAAIIALKFNECFETIEHSSS